MVLQGTACYEGVSLLLQGGLRAMAASWRLDQERVVDAEARLSHIAGPPAIVSGAELPAWGREPVEGGPQPFPLAVLLFGAALRAGWAWALALRLFAGLKVGWACGSGRGFVPERGKGLPPTGRDLEGRWLVSRLASQSDPSSVVTVYFDTSCVAFIECSKPIFAPRRRRARAADRGGRPTSFLPPYVRLPTDSEGRLVFPELTVTSVVERRHVWLRRIPNMDGVVRALVFGKLCYPRVDWRVVPSVKPNHKSWELPEVKAALGPKIATWLCQGALEWVDPRFPKPVIIEPKGAVPKKGPDKFRDIADAREGNKSLADWGVRMHTWQELADALTPCAIVWGHDLKDGYHLAVLSGCTGKLVWGWGVTGLRVIHQEDPEFDHEVAEDGQLAGNREPQVRLVFGWRLHVGCWPWVCCQTCDKACNGMEFDGCCCRRAVAHFGQKTAGRHSSASFSAICGTGRCAAQPGAKGGGRRGGRCMESPGSTISPSTAGCGLIRGVVDSPWAALCARKGWRRLRSSTPSGWSCAAAWVCPSIC
jgi:hypothetical protein